METEIFSTPEFISAESAIEASIISAYETALDEGKEMPKTIRGDIRRTTMLIKNYSANLSNSKNLMIAFAQVFNSLRTPHKGEEKALNNINALFINEDTANNLASIFSQLIENCPTNTSSITRVDIHKQTPQDIRATIKEKIDPILERVGGCEVSGRFGRIRDKSKIQLARTSVKDAGKSFGSR